jgi:hypothetical protein
MRDMSKHLTEWTTTLAMPLDLLAQIDAWRRAQADLPNRREAMRRLMELALVDAPSVSDANS